MSKRRQSRRPSTTIEGREGQLVSLAIDLAEKQMIEGTASSQVITHYLKLGSTREKLEQERLANENLMLRAKAESMESQKRVEELYTEAMDAFRAYSGQETEEVYEYDQN